MGRQSAEESARETGPRPPRVNAREEYAWIRVIRGILAGPSPVQIQPVKALLGIPTRRETTTELSFIR